ncbi:hypothetical protein [Variovorax atrisoli]|uniref:hypothetical protein n=1 Tax=Variovorax atrisoli TaxID=3394203 RepID=UPI00339ABFCB
MTTIASFTAVQRDRIELLRRELTDRTHARVVVDYDTTDNGQHYAALCVEELPAGAFGRPGPLVSILTGKGVMGFAAMTAYGAPIAHGVDFEEAVKAARFAGVREYRAMRKGTLIAA